MNPYNPEATCPKCASRSKGCGGKDVGTQYIEANSLCDVHGYHVGTRIAGEHLHRICRNCGYVWPEMCLDKVIKPLGSDGGIEWGLPPSPPLELRNTPCPLTETCLSEFVKEWRGDAPDF